METQRATTATVDEYIATFSPQVQSILKKIRATIRKAAPEAKESISYRMPAYALEGVLVYFAAFKNHIGFYPPVSGDAGLASEISVYSGPKGNLQFPLDQPIPYALIERIVKHRVKQNQEKAAKKKASPKKAASPKKTASPKKVAPGKGG